MKKIGQGLQFNVYEDGNRVIKLLTEESQIKRKLLLWTPSYLLKPRELEREVAKTMKEREEVLQEIQRREIDLSLLANPYFGGERITQDRVNPLGRYLRDCKQAKRLIKSYINFIFNCWENGFSERTYNLTINNGINLDGEIVLIDFGEITFEKSDVERAIRIKRWQRSWSFKRDMKRDVRDYYDKKMLENLTLQNLNRYWREALIRD